MEVISIIIFIAILIIALIDTHKAIIYFAPVSIMCQPYMCLRYESPAIALLFLSEFTLILLFLVKGGGKRVIKNKPEFPFRNAILAIFITYAIGIVVSPLSLGVTIPYVLSNVVAYIFIAVFFYELKTEKDLTRSLKGLLLVGCILCGYAIIEYLTQSNVFIERLFSELPIEKGWVYYSNEIRFGSIRCQSLMAICISWGGLCSLFLAMVLYFNKTQYSQLGSLTFIAVTVILIALNFFSGTRSSLVFLALVLVGWLLSYWKKPLIQLFFLLAVIIIVFITGDAIFNEVINSFTENSDVSGSSALQRQVQFATAFNVISSSPLWGLGIKGVAAAQDIDFDVLGAESIWLQQLINYGLIGVGVQLFVYYTAIKELLKESFSDKKALVVCIVLGWVSFCTMTSSPGLNEAYFLIIMTMILKARQLAWKNLN